jgi:hypothetical protein
MVHIGKDEASDLSVCIIRAASPDGADDVACDYSLQSPLSA